MILTHLINHTLRDPLVLLSCLLLIKATLNASWRRPWALAFSSCGSGICILYHSAFVSSTVDVDKNRRRHHYLDVILRQIRAANDSNFNWATMAFICDLTTLASVFALLSLAAGLFDINVLVPSFVWLLSWAALFLSSFLQFAEGAFKAAREIILSYIWTCGVSWHSFARVLYLSLLTMATLSFYLLFEIAVSVLHRVVNSRASGTDMTHSEVLISLIQGRWGMRLESGRVNVFRPAALALTRREWNLRDRWDFVHRLLVTVSLINGHFSALDIPWNSVLPTIYTVNATIIDTVQSRMFLFLVGCRCHWSYSVCHTSTESWHPDCAWDRESRGELPRLNWWIGVAICGTSAEE